MNKKLRKEEACNWMSQVEKELYCTAKRMSSSDHQHTNVLFGDVVYTQFVHLVHQKFHVFILMLCKVHFNVRIDSQPHH